MEQKIEIILKNGNKKYIVCSNSGYIYIDEKGSMYTIVPDCKDCEVERGGRIVLLKNGRNNFYQKMKKLNLTI